MKTRVGFKTGWILFFMAIFLGCDSENPSMEDPNMENSSSEDIAPPTISIPELGDVLETATTLNISISDNSQVVNTTVFVNDQEVFSTTERQFQYVVDPFDFNNGDTVLRISSIDTANNESTRTFNFEIRKLLYHQNFGFSSDSVDSFLAINLLETGELIAFRKLETLDDASFYAEDGFQKQDLIITRYLIGVNNPAVHSARSYDGIEPGTIRLFNQGVSDVLGLEALPSPPNASFTLNVTGDAFRNRFSMLGRNYSFNRDQEEGFTINYNLENTNDVFLYYHTSNNEELLSDYRYLYLDEFIDQTIDFENFGSLGAENISSLGLPDDVANYTLGLFGYQTQKEYKEEIFRLIYSTGGDTDLVGNLVLYPEIQEYPLVETNLNLTMEDGKRYNFSSLDLTEVQLPNLQAELNGTSISINGTYDFANLFQPIAHPDTNTNQFLRRTYISLYKDSFENPFETLEIPQEIITILNNDGFEIQPIDTSGEKSLQLIQFQNTLDYPGGVFYTPLRNEVGNIIWSIFPFD